MKNFHSACRGGLPSPLCQLVAHRRDGRQARAAKFPFLRERNRGRGPECLLPAEISLRRATHFHISSQIHEVLEMMSGGSVFPDLLHKRQKRKERRDGPKAHRRISGARKRRWIRHSEEELCGEIFP